MHNSLKNLKYDLLKLYNKIVFLSRNKFLYNIFYIDDTFQNRINLIFIHISFLFIKVKQNKNKQDYKEFSQKMFDFIFKKIEINMRELGYGDVSVNKNMKFLVKIFYNVLLECENYHKKDLNYKSIFLSKILTINNNIEQNSKYSLIIRYFDKYQTFCVDLPIDNVLKGDLNFNYK
jgi:cytochrome b pre-mRNA-processing protein 3